MKTIERPDSTTYLIEFPYHKIRSIEEAKNVFAGKSEEDIFVVSKSIDSNYQPMIAVAIRNENYVFSHWEKYYLPVGYLVEVGLKVRIPV
jgi:hypothetical protein